MCQRTQCNICKKPTYSGCGRHIEAVLGDVPPDQRCRCREQAAATSDQRDAKPKPSFWDRFR